MSKDNENNVDRIELTVPEGWKDAITEKAERSGKSRNRWILERIVTELPVRVQKKLPALRKRGRPQIQ